MAHADRSDLDKKLIGARFADLYLFELERTVLRSDNCSGYLHARPLLEGWSVLKQWITRRSARRSCTPETPPVHPGRSAGQGHSGRSRLPRTGRRRGPRDLALEPAPLRSYDAPPATACQRFPANDSGDLGSSAKKFLRSSTSCAASSCLPTCVRL